MIGTYYAGGGVKTVNPKNPQENVGLGAVRL